MKKSKSFLFVIQFPHFFRMTVVGYTEDISDMRRDPEENRFGMFHMRSALTLIHHRRLQKVDAQCYGTI